MHVAWNKRLSRAIRGRLRRRVLGNFGMAILAQTRNGVLLVDPDDFNVSRKLLRDGEYDWDEIEILSALIEPRGVLLVAGAHIGALAIPIAHRALARSMILIEPSPHNYQRLIINLDLNAVPLSVEPLNIAVGAQPGQIGFTENRINRGNSRACATGELKVDVMRLDDITDQPIDLLVMDIEGYEVHALQGATEMLKRTRNLYVEFAPEQLREQGSTITEFCDLVSAAFPYAYLIRNGGLLRLPDDYATYLHELPSRRGLLLNLLLRPKACLPQ